MFRRKPLSENRTNSGNSGTASEHTGSGDKILPLRQPAAPSASPRPPLPADCDPRSVPMSGVAGFAAAAATASAGDGPSWPRFEDPHNHSRPAGVTAALCSAPADNRAAAAGREPPPPPPQSSSWSVAARRASSRVRGRDMFRLAGNSLDFVFVFVCLWVCVRACVRLRAYACVCVRACVHACVCVCVDISITVFFLKRFSTFFSTFQKVLGYGKVEGGSPTPFNFSLP